MPRDIDSKMDRLVVKSGPPIASEGSEGDMTLRIIRGGVVLFIKFKNKWYGTGVSDKFIEMDAKGNLTCKGDLTVNGGDATIKQTSGDDWKFIANSDHTLTIGNDIASAGTYVDHVTITPNSTATASQFEVAGDIRIGRKLIADQLIVGAHSTHTWKDGWRGYVGHIFLTPADFAYNTISLSGRDSFVYHSVIDAATGGTRPKYSTKSGTGSPGAALTGDANADMIAMTILPRGFMATGAQCWATDGGAGSQPTFRVGYKLLGNDSLITWSMSAEVTTAVDGNIAATDFDAGGDDSYNVYDFETQGGVNHPRIIIMHFIKAHADDQLWGGVIFISPMSD